MRGFWGISTDIGTPMTQPRLRPDKNGMGGAFLASFTQYLCIDKCSCLGVVRVAQILRVSQDKW